MRHSQVGHKIFLAGLKGFFVGGQHFFVILCQFGLKSCLITTKLAIQCIIVGFFKLAGYAAIYIFELCPRFKPPSLASATFANDFHKKVVQRGAANCGFFVLYNNIYFFFVVSNITCLMYQLLRICLVDLS